MTSYETIEFSVDGGLATLTLSRPERLNSLNQQMHKEIRVVLKQVRVDDEIRCLLLTGNGRGFCAGQDLTDRTVSSDSQTPDLGQSIDKNYNPLIRRLTSLELPVVCAVNGVAAGAGANIALACDIVLAAKGASFIQSFSRIGLVPDSGGTWALPRLVGHSQAMALCLLGEKVAAADAQKMGMIWRVVDDEDLLNEATSIGRELAKGPTTGFALTKRALRASSTNSLDEQLDLERDLQRIAGRTADYAEGVDAFVNKRTPTYRGL